MVDRPTRLFGRNTEWHELNQFASSPRPGATLGLVYGRRRLGKTLLLELLARQTGGFMFAATQQTERQSLADLGAAFAAFRGLRQPVLFASWREALDELLRLGTEGPVPVIIDEFPHLSAATPALPSYLQHALSPLSFAKEHTRTRLILCGSVLTTMSELLDGSAPLRGRAILELVLRPFGFREAAGFWGLDNDPDLAFQVNALVGGTPAYLEMCGGEGPGHSEDLPAWVARRLLNPASAMFREGSLLLREEPSISDPTSYASALAAIAAGHHRRSEIAAALGRQSSALGHVLSGLQDIALVAQVDDALRDKRTVFHITEPIIRLHQLLVARHEPELVAGRAERVWAANADTIDSRILGPHFEDISRAWCFEHASQSTLGGYATHVRPTEIACREHKRGHDLDVVVTESNSYMADRVTAIGEAKATRSAMDIPHLERLEHVRGLLPSSRISGTPKLLLFARCGFTPALAELAKQRSDIELVDIHRLYHGE